MSAQQIIYGDSERGGEKGKEIWRGKERRFTSQFFRRIKYLNVKDWILKLLRVTQRGMSL